MRKRLVLYLLYDPETDTVRKASVPAMVGQSADTALSSEAVDGALADIKSLNTGDLHSLLHRSDTKTCVKMFASVSGACLYTLHIRRNRHGFCRMTLDSTPLRQKSSNAFATRIAAALLILSVIGIAFGFTLYMRADMYKKRNADANDTVGMVSEQIDRTFIAEFNSWFKELEMVGTLLQDCAELDGKQEQINATLSLARESLSFQDCGLLLDTGDLYFSENRAYNIAYENLAKELVIHRRAAVDLMDIGTDEYIVFGIPFVTNSRGVSRISAVCGIAKSSSVSDLVTINAFDGRAVVSVIKSDGFRIAVSNNESVGDQMYPNLFRLVHNSVTEDVYNTFEEQYRLGESGSVRIQRPNGVREDFYMYFSPLHVGSGNIPSAETWRLVIFVPESSIFQSVNELFNTILRVLAGVISGAILLLTLFVLTYLQQKNNQLLLTRRAMEMEVLEVTAQKAEEASQAKTVFFANMSHDMRTPLNGIIGMAAIARKHVDEPAVVAECIGKIDDASEHLLSLINNVLDMSRIESGRIEITHEAMNIGALIEECRDIVEGQIRMRNIRFCLDCDVVRDVNVLGDSLHLRQILINLLGNAIKFTPDGGTVGLAVQELSREGNTATYSFTVRDTGVGMSPEFMEKMFEPFTQEHAGSRTAKGSGLGLSIARQLVMLMGGKIGVQSREGEGTAITVQLPLEISETICEEAAGEKESDQVIAERLRGVRVLLAEDNALNREIAETLLTESGMIVESAVDGKEACRMFFAHREPYYDIIMMDVMMPEMDGIEATRTIRSSDNPNAASVIIIAMTANAFEDDIKRTQQAGMDEHLTKPIRIAEVLKAMYRLLTLRKQKGSDSGAETTTQAPGLLNHEGDN